MRPDAPARRPARPPLSLVPPRPVTLLQRRHSLQQTSAMLRDRSAAALSRQWQRGERPLGWVLGAGETLHAVWRGLRLSLLACAVWRRLRR